MDNLLYQFHQNGLIQFGRFIAQDQQTTPLQLSFEFLPSYPQLLVDTAQQLVTLCAQNFDTFDFLFCAAEGIPLGMAMSLQTHKPLLYSTHRTSHARDFIGAYDVGHPAVLISPVFDDEEKIARLARDIQRVGLEMVGIVSLLTLSRPKRLQVVSLYDIDTVLSTFESQEWLPQTQSAHVQTWLANRHRQG